jgi:hypothetical protein
VLEDKRFEVVRIKMKLVEAKKAEQMRLNSLSLDAEIFYTQKKDLLL